MIPKVIHWCWFGRGKLPYTARKCIRSWKKKLPDYVIKLWNEDNFDIHCCKYVEEAYYARKFAFVTDYVRLYALYTEGGIYMDSDVEVIKRIDAYHNDVAFTGFESDVGCITGIMGSEKGGKWVEDLLDAYEGRSLYLENGNLNLTTNVEYTAELMKQKGVDLSAGEINIPGYIHIYPRDYFCPKSWKTGEYRLTANTCTIHHFAASWWTKRDWYLRWVEQRFGVRGQYYVAYFWRPFSVVVRALCTAVMRRFKKVIGR